MYRILFIFVLSVTSFLGFANSAAGNVSIDELPRLQFPVISDPHICGKQDYIAGVPICMEYSRDRNLGIALEDYKNLAPNYKAIAIVGDMTNHGLDQQYEAFKGIVNQNIPSYTEKLLAIGNHEFFEKKYNTSLTDQEMINRFLQHAGKEKVYYDSWIYGYHFIVLGSEGAVNGDYNSAFISEEQYDWLEQTIAVNATENKPIFVFLHQSIKDTVYGSEFWSGISDTRLAEILKNYPQSILFTGHSHYLLEHPRTVFQDGFTMVNTGAVAYGYYDGGDLFNKSQGLLVTVYKNRVEVKARDFGSGTWVNEYSIEVPYRKTYDDQELPYFEEESEIGLEAIDHKSAEISWDPAADNGIIEKYQIYLNGKLWDTHYPRYWEAGAMDRQSVYLGRLLQHTDYDVEIMAIDGYGNKTERPLKAVFQTPWTYSGWVNENGSWCYYDPETGKTKTGWINVDGKRYYMDDTGIMQTGWKAIDRNWYYLNSNGVMETGWKLLHGKWYYMTREGIMQTGWLELNGNWYFLSSNGSMVTGWLLYNDKWYYLEANGVMKKGWFQSGTKWYYLTAKGMVKGWHQVGGKWFYFADNGSMKTGWVLDNTNWYYLDASGVMKTGWFKYNNAWYYLDKNGSMTIGWKLIESKWYYFYESGKMASNTTINGYKLGKDGAMF